MYAFKIGLIALFALFPVRVFAQDIAIYGGQLFDRDFDFDSSETSFAVSAGFDLPENLKPLGMDQIRTDFTYSDYDVSQTATLVVSPLPPGAMPPFPTVETRLDVESKSFYFHTGPSWRVENVLGPIDFSLGVQAGLVHTDSTRVVYEDGILAPNSPLQFDGSFTNFSYQFPVEMEIPLSERISFSTRYRPIGRIYDGDNSFQHAIEGGIRIRF